jgi:hypothetical protein
MWGWGRAGGRGLRDQIQNPLMCLLAPRKKKKIKKRVLKFAENFCNRNHLRCRDIGIVCY